MGLLKEPKFWGNLVNEFFNLEPVPVDKLKSQQAEKVLGLVCKALTKLLNDPDFKKDIEFAHKNGGSLDSLDQFLRNSAKVEEDIFIKSGVNRKAAKRMIDSLGQLEELDLDAKVFKNLEGNIGLLCKIACNGYTELMDQEDRKKLIKDVVLGFIGVATMGADVAAIAASHGVPPIVNAAKGSITIGAAAIAKALFGRW